MQTRFAREEEDIMKKVLLGTSALIAAAAISAPAMAQEQIQLGIGGKMEQYFGVTSFDDTAGTDLNTTGIDTDTEVYFTGATTLDNGLTVGAVIQLEAEVVQGAAVADEQYAYIEGAFGRITAGEVNGVGGRLAHVAPAFGLAKGDVEDWTGQAPGMGRFNSNETTWSADDASISYVTPSLAGFSAGVTYTPTPGSALLNNNVQTSATTRETHDGLQAAIAYNGEFSGVGIGADVAYEQQTADDVVGGQDFEDLKRWRAGLVLSYAGFQFGGSYLETDNLTGANTGTIGGVALTSYDEDAYAWDIGAGYTVGPYGVSLTYSATNAELAGSAVGATASADSDYQQLNLNGTYDLGPGITLAGSVFWAESETEATTTVGGVTTTASTDTDGTGAVVGLQLSF
ncbi:porin [Caenispirillum salinarum]|uniref:porin n=1 Tax=Caenispirillum salinarum TaxID=859058 RepID=UPI0038501FD9